MLARPTTNPASDASRAGHRSTSPPWVILSFAGAAVTSGSLANVGYTRLLTTGGGGDALSILFVLLGVLIVFAFSTFTFVVAIRVTAGWRAAPRATPVAALVGAYYGTIPALGMAYGDWCADSVLNSFLVWGLILAAPTMLPVWLFRTKK